jgi:hypothetical protein
MYYIAICEIFNPRIHGKDENSSIGIENHFLLSETFELAEFYDNSYQETITALKYDYKRVAKNNLKSLKEPHPTIRNYNNIIKDKNYIKLDIVVVDELAGGETVGYIKTFWIKLIQRRWKKIYKQRQDILKQRMLPKSIREREITGKWPKGLRIWPKGLKA